MQPKEEYSDWSKIPVMLQHRFFELANEEAKRTKIRISENARKLEGLRHFIHFKALPENDDWKDWRIACVDGSDSPVASERVGARFGTCAAGYMIFEGDRFTGEEEYFSGELRHDQIGDSDVTKKILELLTTKLERETALLCLKEKDVDTVLIDGSFFGFRVKCGEVRDEPTGLKEFPLASDLIDHTRDRSIELLESKKVFGIIKRVTTAVIDGWIAYRNDGREENCMNRNDRDILASLMPEKHWFAYEWLLGLSEVFNYFSRLRTTLKYYPGRSMDAILRECELRFAQDIDRNLNWPTEDILNISRYFVRCSKDVMPFCLEAHREVDVTSLLGYFQANYNPATGLPFPIDLTDQNVALPRGFTKEFVEEIEAQLIKDPELDKYDLLNHFMSLNPQKEEG